MPGSIFRQGVRGSIARYDVDRTRYLSRPEELFVGYGSYRGRFSLERGPAIFLGLSGLAETISSTAVSPESAGAIERAARSASRASRDPSKPTRIRLNIAFPPFPSTRAQIPRKQRYFIAATIASRISSAISM